jgi:hypothetical protein
MADNDTSSTDTVAGTDYRFTHLSIPLVMRDMRFGSGDPGPGDPFPEFDLPTLDGGRIRTADLAASGPMLIVFGSATCPITDSAVPGLKALHARYGEQVRFVVVNVREAHPGAEIPQPTTIDEKRAHAERLRNLYGFTFDVAVDDIDGALHRAVGPKPNSAYLVDKSGVILFRAHWANSTAAINDALEAVVAGRPLTRGKSGGMPLAVARSMRNIPTVLDRAGKGAWADMWRVAPPMTATAFLLRLAGLGRSGA